MGDIFFDERSCLLFNVFFFPEESDKGVSAGDIKVFEGKFGLLYDDFFDPFLISLKLGPRHIYRPSLETVFREEALDCHLLEEGNDVAFWSNHKRVNSLFPLFFLIDHAYLQFKRVEIVLVKDDLRVELEHVV